MTSSFDASIGVPSKECFKCRKTLPLVEFYAHPMMADGRLNKCCECTKKDVREQYRKSKPARAAYERERFKRPERKKAVSGYQRTMREKNPEKTRARQALQRAVLAGRVIKSPCILCGDVNSQAHHDDYLKPLDVEWLCFRCHREHRHGQAIAR